MLIRFVVYILFFFSFNFLYSQSIKVDSLLNSLERTKDSDKKAIIYLSLSLEYEASDVQKSFDYGLKALFEAEKKKTPFVLSEVYNNLANVYEYKSVSDSSYIYHKKALNLRLKLNDPIKIGDSYNNIAIYYDRVGNFPASLKNYFKALRYYEQEDDIEKQGMVFSNIGIVYKAQKEYDKSLEYYQKAKSIYEQLGSEFGVTVSEGNIGSVLLSIGDYKQSIEYSEKAKEGYTKLGYDRLRIYPLINTAVAHDSLKNYQEAEKLYLESIELYQKQDNNYELSSTLNAYAGCLIKQGKYQQSISILEKALDYAKKSNGVLQEIATRKNLAQAYSKLNNYPEAFRQMQLYNVVKDSLFEEEKTKAVFELEKQYQTEKKEKEILEQRAVIAENNLKIEHKNTQIIIACFLILASILVGYIFFYKQKQKAKRLERENLLKDAYAKIETQKQLEKQRLKISRDLHDNIGSQLTFIISSLENIKYYFKEANSEVNNRIDSISKFTRQTISELRDTIWAMNKDQVTFEDLCARLTDFIGHASNSVSEVSFDFEVDTQLESIDYQFTSLEGINLFRVIQEAVNNAVKHAEATQIKVSITKSKDTNYRFLVSVLDNGKGFSDSKISSGNGLSNMEKRISEAGGEISFDSTPQGTAVRIWI